MELAQSKLAEGTGLYRTQKEKNNTFPKEFFTWTGTSLQQHSGGSTCGPSGCTSRLEHSWHQEPDQANLAMADEQLLCQSNRGNN